MGNKVEKEGMKESFDDRYIYFLVYGGYLIEVLLIDVTRCIVEIIVVKCRLGVFRVIDLLGGGGDVRYVCGV